MKALEPSTALADEPDEVTERRNGAITALERELQAELRECAKDLSADAVTLLLYDAETNQFVLPLQQGLRDPETFTDRELVPGTDRLAGKIVRERIPIFADQVSGHAELDGPFARREGIASAASLPLIGVDIALGVLFVSYRTPHRFTESERDRLYGWGRRIVETVSRQDVPFEWLRSEGGSETDQTLDGIAKLGCHLINMPIGIWLVEPENHEVKLRASTGLTHGYIAAARARRGDGSAIAEVLDRGQDITIKNLEADSRFRYHEQARQASWQKMLALPICSRGHTIGVIQVFSIEPEDFRFEQSESLRRLADMVSVAIENSRRSTEAEELAALASKLSALPDVQSAMREIVGSAVRITRADSGTIVLLDPNTGNFVIGSRQPHACPPAIRPRSEGGLTESIVKTGKSILVEDTRKNEQVNPDLRNAGIRSMAGVRLQLEERRFGVLYVHSARPAQFTARDVGLLCTVADQASVALGWRRFLLDPWGVIEEASAALFRRDEHLESFCDELDELLGFDYSALQLVRRDQEIVETVYATGIAKPWAGRPRHYLHEDPCLRDIQADIVLGRPGRPLRAEIISGWDPRFDEGIYKEFDHQNLIRIFAPLAVVKNRSGRLEKGWFDKCEWQVVRNEQKADGCRVVIEMQPCLEGDDGPLELDVIGTVEAGYQGKDRSLGLEVARQVIEFACRNARNLRRGMLRHVLETIVEQVRRVAGADSASLHFRYDPDQGRYLEEVRTGLDFKFLDRFPPRKQGIGHAAIAERRVKFIPDPAEGHDENEFARLRPDLAAEGIHAMAAVPLFVHDAVGVLYLHYLQRHRFRKDEIRWVQLLASRAIDAVQHTSVYTEIRDRVRQLRTLQSVGQYLVSDPEDETLLRKIAWSILDTLAADVVTIYEYNESERRFEFPPAIAGRLRNEPVMQTEIHAHDAPALLVEANEDVFVSDPTQMLNHAILNRPDRQRPKEHGAEPFVIREGIQSTAGVLLKVGGETVGVMFINYRRVQKFPAEDRHGVTSALASAAAIAIRNKRLLKKRQQDLMTITHNLQGPLLAVSGSLSLLLDRSVMSESLDDHTPVPVSKSVHKVMERSFGLTEDVVAISQGLFTSFAREAGRKISLKPECFDAPAELAEICDRMQMTHARPDLHFVYENDEDFPELRFDKEIFTIVIYNLVHNALRHSKRNSTVRIRCRYDSVAAKALLEVESTGAKIDESEKEKIFNKFYQAKAVRNSGRRHGGVGLGLWSARDSMRCAKGDLRLELSASDPHLATFIVEIPQPVEQGEG